MLLASKTFDKLERLARDCDIEFQEENEFSVRIRGNLAMVSGEYAFDEARFLLDAAIPADSVTHTKLIKLKESVGKSIRKLENLRIIIENSESFYEQKRVAIDEHRKTLKGVSL
jgi:hypothetical protein